MANSQTEPNKWASSTTRNKTRLNYWTFAWVATTALAAFGPRFIWDFATLPTTLSVFVNLGIGFGMIVANKKYLQGLDEMQQKIFLDACAITLGVGLVCGLSYDLLEDIKIISYGPQISHLIMLMCAVFLTTIIAGNRRYR
ncbi:MAG: hypothetical protein ACJAYE_001166 [Candidatus Azotimanducaceae bacterium]|jgi:hypothetical protein